MTHIFVQAVRFETQSSYWCKFQPLETSMYSLLTTSWQDEQYCKAT